MTESQIDAALVRSAHMARSLALEHCPHAGRGNCSWYHSVWQYFRALGVTKTAGGSSAYFDEALRSLARDGARRVLISGAADDAMSLVALAAFRAAGKPLELTVVDLCETPLALARWSAQALGASVLTCRSDILAFDRAGAFDIVMSNSFLGAFAPEERRALFARWASLLRPGGKVLLTNRLRPGSGHARFGFTEEQARSFCATVRREAERARAVLGVDPGAIEGWARVYTERYRSCPLRTVDEVLELLRAARLTPERIDTARFPGRSGSRVVAGPSVAEPADYVRVLATRS